jgi:hypothetical protein
MCGIFGYVTLLVSVVGLVLIITKGRASGRPGSYAAAYSVVVLASGILGFGSGIIRVGSAVQSIPSSDLTKRIELVAIGNSEAVGNLIVAGSAVLVLMAVGAILALMVKK